MPRIHKIFPFLLSNESQADIFFDLVYRPDRQLVWPSTTLIVDYDLSRLGKLQASNSMCAELEDCTGPYQRLLIQVAPFDSLQQIKRDIFAASRSLAPTGELRVTVPPKSGAKRIKSDLQQVFGTVEAVKSAGSSLFICRKPAPQALQENMACLKHHDPISGLELKFLVRPGIFSSEKLDAGTMLLMNTVRLIKGQKILDVGCGYGAIGATAAARGAVVTLLDVDARVVKLAEKNLTLNDLDGSVITKLQPYDFSDNAFDVVLSNPPTHAGSATLRQLFAEMVRVSREQVVLVVREHLKYEKWLNDLAGVSNLVTADGYKVLQLSKG